MEAWTRRAGLSAQYSKFEAERNRPIMDLLARIPNPQGAVTRAADLGCGPGNSTELLLRQFPGATIVGMDSSEDMVAAARRRLPEVRFEVDDIATWRDSGPFDVIFANASLQWVPDHETLFPFLIGKLAPGGSLAVQMPDNLEEPAHRLMREIAATGPWASRLSGVRSHSGRHTPQWYYEMLCGEITGKVSTLDVWRTTYFHALAGGAAAVVEWFKGTGLRPYLDALTSEDERTGFLQAYQEAINVAYPAMADGTVLLPFPRLFIVATR